MSFFNKIAQIVKKVDTIAPSTVMNACNEEIASNTYTKKEDEES